MNVDSIYTKGYLSFIDSDIVNFIAEEIKCINPYHSVLEFFNRTNVIILIVKRINQTRGGISVS